MQPKKSHNDSEHGSPFGQFKRKYRRDKVRGFVGNIADGQKIIDGIVDNLSPGGFEITNLPRGFTGEGYAYTAILSGGGKHYKLLTKPCWRRKQGNDNVVGFKILDAPWQWLAFTMHDIPSGHES